MHHYIITQAVTNKGFAKSEEHVEQSRIFPGIEHIHIPTLPGVVYDVYFPEPEWEGSC